MWASRIGTLFAVITITKLRVSLITQLRSKPDLGRVLRAIVLEANEREANESEQ